MKVIIFLLFILLIPRADAAEWLHDIEVVKVGAYQSGTGHFVWFSTTPPGCTTAVSQNPVMNFDDSKPGGKALLAVLIDLRSALEVITIGKVYGDQDLCNSVAASHLIMGCAGTDDQIHPYRWIGLDRACDGCKPECCRTTGV